MKSSEKVLEAELPGNGATLSSNGGHSSVSNSKPSEALSLDELEAEFNLAEGGEAALEGDNEVSEEEFLRDAYFGTYTDVAPRATTGTEVIIGADDRVRVSPTTSFPWSAICALKITAANGQRFIGTGWLISGRTVVTAGHCVYMHGAGGWVRSIEVIPGQNDGASPFGSCVATNFRTVMGWVNGPNANYDYGAIILPQNFPLGNLTGGVFRLSVLNDNQLLGTTLNLSGYPGDKGGRQQWFHYKRAKSVSARRITYDIDTMGGQSGSPVWYRSGNNRYAVGIHTNGHSSGNSATRIAAPVFNNLTAWRV